MTMAHAYETKSEQPIGRARFLRRIGLHMGIAFLLIIPSIGIGMLGYMGLERMSATDAFLNSAMLLGGMGPVNPPTTEAGKLFAGCYALFAGLVFILTAALVFSPVIHRVIHHFHWDRK
jgi:hypothetical protein